MQLSAKTQGAGTYRLKIFIIARMHYNILGMCYSVYSLIYYQGNTLN